MSELRQQIHQLKSNVTESASISTHGTTSGGYTWRFEAGREVPWKSDVDANTFIRVKDPDGKTVAGVWADVAEGLNFDEIYGKYLKVTDNNGDPGKPGFSLVTPLNGESWNWRERPEFKDLVKQKLNDPGFLGDHKYQQIIDAMSGKQFNPTKHIAKENFADQGSGSTDRDNADYMKRRRAANKAGYTGRETKAGTWRVFKDGNAVAAAGPFKSADEAAAWIKKHKQGVTEGAITPMKPRGEKPFKPSMDRPKGEWDPIHGKAPRKGTLAYDIWKQKVNQDKGIKEADADQVLEARRPTDFATITIENPDDTGDIDLEVGYHTEGDYYPATRLEPASYPEIIIDSVRRTDTGAEILSTLDDDTYEYILNQLYDRQEQYEGVNEISDKTKASYQKQAQKQVQDLMPHARTGEYRDMAKNIINKRQQGLARLGTVAENMLADYARNLDSISEEEGGISMGDLDEQGVSEGLESLESLIGKRVYVKSVGEMGTVSDVSAGHRNSLIVDLVNGDREIAHFTDLSQERPGMMRRMIDKIKSPVAATAPLKESAEANNSDADVAELRRLAGLK
jgi:hypothetical protein